ncbi:MAG: threonine--tRNA ligase, partial [Asgard group archaeon]|nr:threonine--tRNA ligase [Asgard group archaeon]
MVALKSDESNDHRMIGSDMDLFSFHDEAPGFPFYKHNFLIIRNELLRYWRELHNKQGYLEIETPIIMRNDLWVTSGHWDCYKDNMFWFKDQKEIKIIRPMNCPGSILVFKEKLYSYRDLPLKICEIGKDFRKELSGVIQGLFRTRGFSMDDAHIFTRQDQIYDVVSEVVDIVELIYRSLGFQYKINLSTRPEKS